jgi:hypothetical protein
MSSTSALCWSGRWPPGSARPGAARRRRPRRCACDCPRRRWRPGRRASWARVLPRRRRRGRPSWIPRSRRRRGQWPGPARMTSRAACCLSQSFPGPRTLIGRRWSDPRTRTSIGQALGPSPSPTSGPRRSGRNPGHSPSRSPGPSLMCGPRKLTGHRWSGPRSRTLTGRALSPGHSPSRSPGRSPSPRRRTPTISRGRAGPRN